MAAGPRVPSIMKIDRSSPSRRAEDVSRNALICRPMQAAKPSNVLPTAHALDEDDDPGCVLVIALACHCDEE